MGVFKTEKILRGDAALIPGIAEAIADDFRRDLFEVKVTNLVSGGADISLAKGGVFKAILGLKSALKITMLPTSDGIVFSAGVGIFGQQVIPSAISLFITWPVLITQIWGMVQQSKLDDRALEIAERYLAGQTAGADTLITSNSRMVVFCTHCGTELPRDAHFCSNCGRRV